MQQTLSKHQEVKREINILPYILGICLKYHFKNKFTQDILRKHTFCMIRLEIL